MCKQRVVVQHVWALSEHVSTVPQAELGGSRAVEEEIERTSIFLTILRV